MRSFRLVACQRSSFILTMRDDVYLNCLKAFCPFCSPVVKSSGQALFISRVQVLFYSTSFNIMHKVGLAKLI